jgi:hypothetical protein
MSSEEWFSAILLNRQLGGVRGKPSGDPGAVEYHELALFRRQDLVFHLVASGKRHREGGRDMAFMVARRGPGVHEDVIALTLRYEIIHLIGTDQFILRDFGRRLDGYCGSIGSAVPRLVGD